MKENIANLIPRVDLCIEGATVTLEMKCADKLAARVLFEDLQEKITSGQGLTLRLRGNLHSEAAE